MLRHAAVGWLRSRGFGLSLLVACAVALLGAVAADLEVDFPMFPYALPVSEFLVWLAAVMVGSPLQDRFGELDRAAVRARCDRALSVVLVCGTTGLSLLPVALRARDFTWSTPLFLVAVGIVAVTVLGPPAWSVSLMAGLAVVYVDVNRHDLVRDVLDTVGIPALSVLLLLVASGFVAYGPGPHHVRRLLSRR